MNAILVLVETTVQGDVVMSKAIGPSRAFRMSIVIHMLLETAVHTLNTHNHMNANLQQNFTNCELASVLLPQSLLCSNIVHWGIALKFTGAVAHSLGMGIR